MKKLILVLPFLLLFATCEEEADDPTLEEIMIGTWKVTNMGVYENDDCTGALDYSEWAFAEAFGVAISFTFKSDGTLDLSVSMMGMTDIETVTWEVVGDEVVVEGENANFLLSSDNKTLTFIESEDAYCEDSSGDEVDMTESACGTAGNDWYEAACYEYTLTQ